MTKYADSGVSLDLGDAVKGKITRLIRSTFGDSVITRGGEFGGVFKVPGSNTLAVSSIDGVGTKLRVAILAQKHDTVGQDLVNHCVNDIAVMGALPGFFLDYFATGGLDEAVVQEVVSGLVNACKANGVALIGGETAQMPGIYTPGDYDLAGAIVGFMGMNEVLPKEGFRSGDLVIGVASNGLHTNGYSLVRRIMFESHGADLSTYAEELGTTWGEELLRVHKSYLTLIGKIRKLPGLRGLAHITGGGIPGNLSRIIPDDLAAFVDTRKIESQPVFELLQKLGEVSSAEMFDVFNMGVGLIAVADQEAASTILELSPNSTPAWIIGSIGPRPSESGPIILEGLQ